jgi:hypothetical protein
LITSRYGHYRFASKLQYFNYNSKVTTIITIFKLKPIRVIGTRNLSSLIHYLPFSAPNLLAEHCSSTPADASTGFTNRGFSRSAAQTIVQANQIRMYRRATNLQKELQVSKIQDEIIIGTMLGDCSIEKARPLSNARLQFKQSTKNKLYIEHLFDIFKEFCGTEPKIMSKFDSRANRNKVYEAIKFQTFSLPCFNLYKEIFYNKNGVKIVPLNLEELLTVRGLAY